VAALSSGLLADKFGRRHVSMCCLLLLAIASLLMIFAHDYPTFAVASFFVAFGETGSPLEIVL
jgi:AAHS family benzoate transporter-like MFS transporter